MGDKNNKQLRKAIPWQKIFQDYLEMNLKADKPGEYSLAKIAKKWDVNPTYLRARAAKEKWLDQVLGAVTRKKELVVAKITEYVAETEAETRKRQVMYSRLAQSIAAKKLNEMTEIEIKKLAPSTAMKMLVLGMEQERDALGMPTRPSHPVNENPAGDGWGTVNQRVKEQKHLMSLAKQLIEYIAKRKGNGEISKEGAIDAEFSETTRPESS